MGPKLKYEGNTWPLVVDLTVQETLDLEDEFGRDAATWTSTRQGIARVWATLRRNGVMFTVADVMREADADAFTYDFDPAPDEMPDPPRAEEADAGAGASVATASGPVI